MKEKLRLLNPKNLEKEVDKYGYKWSLKSHIALTFAALAGMGAIGFIFRLQAGYLAVAMAAVLLLLPILVLDVFQKMFEQKRFSDAATYMEQMLYSFQKSGKILLALKESRTLFEDGQMRGVIQEAICYLERGQAKGEKGILKEALEIIERPYDCKKLYLVHELLINAEIYGGECETSILLLLKDIELWKRRGYKLQKDKKNSHTDNMISIVIAVILCASALYILDSMKNLFGTAKAPFDIFQVAMIQCSSLIFILFCIYVFAKSTKNLTGNWLIEAGSKKTEDVLENYYFVLNYDEKRERKKSFLMAFLPMLAAVLLFLLKKYAIAVLLFLIVLFLLVQHRVGYALAKKEVTEEIYTVFPQWLMQVALLLQSNNVQVSIQKSIVNAPDILKPELERLMTRIEEAPDQITSYTGFCAAYDIPEAASCMKMFHAISEAGSGNAKEQIKELLKRVGEMQGMADEIRNKSIAFQMKMIFSYPVVAATVKLLCDFTIGMLYMFRMLGSMGGGAA